MFICNDSKKASKLLANTQRVFYLILQQGTIQIFIFPLTEVVKENFCLVRNVIVALHHIYTRAHSNARLPLTTPLLRPLHGDTNVWQWRMALATRDAAAVLRLRGTGSTRALFFKTRLASRILLFFSPPFLLLTFSLCYSVYCSLCVSLPPFSLLSICPIFSWLPREPPWD